MDVASECIKIQTTAQSDDSSVNVDIKQPRRLESCRWREGGGGGVFYMHTSCIHVTDNLVAINNYCRLLCWISIITTRGMQYSTRPKECNIPRGRRNAIFHEAEGLQFNHGMPKNHH